MAHSQPNLARTEDERALQRHFAAALTDDGFSKFPFADASEAMSRMGDNGYAAGATMFLALAQNANVPRAKRSAAFTSLARYMLDQHASTYRVVTEKAVAFFSRFVSHIAAEKPEWVAEWVADMATGAENKGVPQPTAFIRGLLLTGLTVQPDRRTFWNEALKLEQFPLRIFTDPCAPEEGVALSAAHVRNITALLTFVTDEAAGIVARHIRDHLKWKQERQPDGEEYMQKTKIVPVELTATERTVLLQDFAEGVLDNGRAKQLREWFGLAAK